MLLIRIIRGHFFLFSVFFFSILSEYFPFFFLIFFSLVFSFIFLNNLRQSLTSSSEILYFMSETVSQSFEYFFHYFMSVEHLKYQHFISLLIILLFKFSFNVKTITHSTTFACLSVNMLIHLSPFYNLFLDISN